MQEDFLAYGRKIAGKASLTRGDLAAQLIDGCVEFSCCCRTWAWSAIGLLCVARGRGRPTRRRIRWYAGHSRLIAPYLRASNIILCGFSTASDALTVGPFGNSRSAANGGL